MDVKSRVIVGLDTINLGTMLSVLALVHTQSPLIVIASPILRENNQKLREITRCYCKIKGFDQVFQDNTRKR